MKGNLQKEKAKRTDQKGKLQLFEATRNLRGMPFWFLK